MLFICYWYEIFSPFLSDNSCVVLLQTTAGHAECISLQWSVVDCRRSAIVLCREYTFSTGSATTVICCNSLQTLHSTAAECDRWPWVCWCMQDLRAGGYPTLFSFVNAFLEAKDSVVSSQVSQMIGIHGPSLLAGFEIHQPEIVLDSAISTLRKLVDLESSTLSNHFKPRKGASVNFWQMQSQLPPPPFRSFGRLTFQMCQRNHRKRTATW